MPLDWPDNKSCKLRNLGKELDSSDLWASHLKEEEIQIKEDATKRQETGWQKSKKGRVTVDKKMKYKILLNPDKKLSKLGGRKPVFALQQFTR